LKAEGASMRKGFTLLEVLVAAVILAILGSIVARTLVDQADLGRRVQARNEVQDKARMVMELVKQDLFLAGSSRYVTFSGSGNSFAAPVTSSVPNWTDCSTNPCLSADSANSTTLQDRFSVRYVTSLRDLNQACRKVTYAFSDSTLQRSDVVCNGNDSLQPLADQVLALNLRFECSDGASEDAGSPPCSGNRYPRAALVTVVVASTDPAPGNPSDAVSFAILTGNSTQTVTCPLGASATPLRKGWNCRA
jgi:prepilin-type N-terminal cleavage/methylation domain-containing protein